MLDKLESKVIIIKQICEWKKIKQLWNLEKLKGMNIKKRAEFF